MKNILFITWDGPQTSYMEGLFMPIFHEIRKQDPGWKFHVLQFTWADEEKLSLISDLAKEFGICYQSIKISKKPIASLGSFITLLRGSTKIEKYILDNSIDIVMPRSTFPAFMVNKIRNKKFNIIFDADGLPIEERVDFSGLSRNSMMYKFLKSTETRMLNFSDFVITRSQKSIELHLQTIGEVFRDKFSVVYNGRNKEEFNFNQNIRTKYREKLQFTDEKLFVYAGSLGPQYCLPEMLSIFSRYQSRYPAYFLVLTGNIDFAQRFIPQNMSSNVIIKKVDSSEVANYLNSADIAFALREPSYSMQGVAPIKLGEYLLCGLPVIGSKGIGDSEDILKDFKDCFLYDHSKKLEHQISSIENFLIEKADVDRMETSKKATNYFSLEIAAQSYIKALKSLQK